jgi:glycogen synthase
LVYDDKELWQRLQRNGMLADLSWERAAREYLNAYQLVAATKR